MMGHIPEEIISKLRKLEAMANPAGGASENEIAMCLGHIRRIRDEYDVTEADMYETPQSVKVVKEEAMQWNRITGWQKTLAWAVAELFDCQWYTGSVFKGYTKAGSVKMYKSVMFVGTVRDAELCCQLYEQLYYIIRVMMTMRYGSGNWTLAHRSYAEGICYTIRERARATKGLADAKAAVGAIVLVKGKAVDDFMGTLGLTYGKARKSMTDGAAFSTGRADGKNVDLTPAGRKVRGGRQKALPGS